MPLSFMDDYRHDNFEVVRKVDLFGGYEELRHKNPTLIAACTRFFRKSVTPNNHEEFDALMELEQKVMGDGTSGTAYPVYEHEGRKWVLLSVPESHYHMTGLPA
ncbi:hypothetical protein P691DRAFT_684645 [Macrolepiota fuliginosa MF-IS2]|uniref:Uncharacterized protein n=1 Tax=Macrolepiota fuliginosa MF-IS2 TaxID=1400762 RepID=A0A9P6BVX4_9AGAR|nr:hypothetical protein P691DRAFT_684645 [Macrolepiota fuliginosa MF-IS2]